MAIGIRPATTEDHDSIFAAFGAIVDALEGFPQAPPLTRSEFDDYWINHSSGVWVATSQSNFAGAYYLKPNFVGRGAHIANAGYFVTAAQRGQGIGRLMVEHSFTSARQCGFDAMQFNLVFTSNPARALYERLGFAEIGRVPSAIDGEDAVMYWRSLTEDTT
jgi:ribosomal protein S18 acetylase RimI-like enzyme